MRPRINSFGKYYFNDMKKYLTDNSVYGTTVKINKDTLTYTFLMMYRKNKENPEELFIEVSQASKLVLGGHTNKGVYFKNIEELKNYTKRWN